MDAETKLVDYLRRTACLTGTKWMCRSLFLKLSFSENILISIFIEKGAAEHVSLLLLPRILQERSCQELSIQYDLYGRGLENLLFVISN